MLRNALIATALLALAVIATPARALMSSRGGGCNCTCVTIQCPPNAKFQCGTPTDPDSQGYATATSTCPGPVTITYQDLPGQNGCPAERFLTVIYRYWTATDACGNTASCVQTIDVVRQLWSLDIKPLSCPNPIQVGAGTGGVVTMALLGRAGQDVARIDPATVAIWREGCAYGAVRPIEFGYDDLAAPWPGGDRCNCWTAGPDGQLDLRLKFNRYDLVQGLGLAGLPRGTYVRLVVSATTFDGCDLLATDCVRIQ